MATEVDSPTSPRFIPPTWEAVLADRAGVLVLWSDEFRHVLSGTGIDSWELRRQLWDAAPELILKAPDYVLFDQVLDLASTWEEIRERLPGLGLPPSWRRWAVTVLTSFAGTVVAAILIAESLGRIGPLLVVFSLVVFLLVVAGVAVLASPSAVYEPTDITDDSRDMLAREVVGPFLREMVSERVNTPAREQRLYVTSAPGLSGLSDRDQVAPTWAAERLARVVAGMTYGSVAVCGKRGVGKTTLLRSLCDAGMARPDEPELRVLVSAPVDYDVREFVLHLFARLCTAVIGEAPRREPFNLPNAPELARRTGRRLRRFLTGGMALLCTVAGGGLLTGLLPPGAAPLWTEQLRPLLDGLHALADPQTWASARMPLGGALLFLAIVFAYRTARRPPGKTNSVDHSVPSEARRHLDRIRFLQTYTTGYSGGLKAPAGVEVGAQVGRELAEQQLTLPELIDAYRAFAEQAAEWWRAQHAGRGRLVIGIDEVDRINDADSAERFLNDLKAVFGSAHCVYLVSVSEEALARFQLRVPGGRTVFDSAFDEIIGVNQLHYAEVRELLRRRVAGISDPFVALCHALSGGLPRDVLRTARALVAGVASAGEPVDLADQATRLINEEIAALKYATIRTITTTAPANADSTRPERAPLLRHLVNEEWPGDGPDALTRAADQVRSCQAGPVPHTLAATLRYLAAVAELFGPSLDDLIKDIRADGAIVETLAQTRAALSVDAELAEELVVRARRNLKLPC